MFNSNASSADAGGANYIEDVFSTWLYTGNGSTQTITNGIDLAGEGGLVWIKSRTNSGGLGRHSLWDTVRGRDKVLVISTSAQDTGVGAGQGVTSFNSDGFSLGTPYYETNVNADSVASWTFREQPKFFDVVTYTGTGSARTVAHNLGAVPGCIIVKRLNTDANWLVFHRSVGATAGLFLNTSDEEFVQPAFWNDTLPTANNFTVGTNANVNGNGDTYVAYIFAHDAGGFGLTGTDNVISCGSYTGNGSATGPVVSLGYEPQWLMVKNASGTGDWQIIDSMRGMPVGSADATLQADLTSPETSVDYVSPTATGFQVTSTSSEVNTSASTYIYIAIRRGPMAVPTTGMSVFSPITSSVVTGTKNTTGFPVDLQLQAARGVTHNTNVVDRLRGASSTDTQSAARLITNDVNAEDTSTTARGWDNTGFLTPSGFSNVSLMYWNFRRAPGFFDEVCYTGTGSARTVAHNLAAVPELMIVKCRSNSPSGWAVYSSATGATKALQLNTDDSAGTTSAEWNDTAPTNSVFTVGISNDVNGSGRTYVAYLFGTVLGVSKVGSYTGTATTQTINCGFTAGSRFVLIKRTDSTGDWYVWDSARGIVAGNDPYLLLNSTAAEVTSTDYVDTAASGFELTSTAPAALNASGGTYIFLAIA